MTRVHKILIAAAIPVVGLVGFFAFVFHGVGFIGNFHVSPYFSHPRFAQVQRGMSEEEVRDVVGPPLQRKTLEDGSCRWDYSTQMRADERYMRLAVTFDEERKVVEMGKRTCDPFRDPVTSEWVLSGDGEPANPWKVTKFDCEMIQGDAPGLGKEPKKVYVVIVMDSLDDAFSAMLSKVQELISKKSQAPEEPEAPTEDKETKDVPPQLMLISVGEKKEAMEEDIKKHNLEIPVAWGPKTEFVEPVNEERIPLLLVLKGNQAYPFDFPPAPAQMDRYHQDLTWFLKNYEPQKR